MRNIRNLSRIKTAIRHTGITVKNSPSVDHPIAVTVFYRNNGDGSISCFWPKGNRQTARSVFFSANSPNAKHFSMYSLLFNLGLEGFLAHGKLTLYADLPTATYLQQQWRFN